MIDNVVPFAAPSTDEKPSLSALQAYQHIIRKWGGLLDPFELALALTIADRTIGWGKDRVQLSSTKILTGDKVYSGLKMGRTKMFEALASLERLGIISRHPHPEGKEIKVYSINLGWSQEVLNVPKRLKDQSATRTTPSATRTTPVRHADTIERNQGERNPEKENYTPRLAARGPIQPAEVVREKLGEASAAHRAAAERSANAKERISAIEARWKLALADVFPEQQHCPWSMREKGQMNAKMKMWLHARQISFGDFVEWSVRNWSMVVAVQLKWMTKDPPPTIPAVGFFVSFIDHFAEAWGERLSEKWLNAPERTKMEYLARRGLSREEAAAEIGKDRAITVMRDENRKAQIEARARIRQAQIAEERAERAQVVRIPDPRSRVALGINVDKPLSNTVPELKMIPLDPNWEPPE